MVTFALLVFGRSCARAALLCRVVIGALVFGRGCILPLATLLRWLHWISAHFESCWLVRRDTGVGVYTFQGGCGVILFSTSGRGVSVAASSCLLIAAADKPLAESSPRVSPENTSYNLIRPPPTLRATSARLFPSISSTPAASCAIWRREHCHRKPPENSPASRPRSTCKASIASTKLVRAPRQTPLRRHPYYAAAVAWPSDAIGGPDRDQSHLLCTPTRAAWAALWGHAIILAPSAALNTAAVLICMSADPALISQNSVVLLYEFLLQESHQF